MIRLARKKHYFIVVLVLVSFLFTFVAPAFAQEGGNGEGNGGSSQKIEAPAPPSSPNPPANGTQENFSPPGQENNPGQSGDNPGKGHEGDNPGKGHEGDNPGKGHEGENQSGPGVPADQGSGSQTPITASSPGSSPGNPDHNEGVGQTPEKSDKENAINVHLTKEVIGTFFPTLNDPYSPPAEKVGGRDDDRWTPVPKGGYIKYRITVSNQGEAEATNIELWDNIPAHTSFYSADPNATHDKRVEWSPFSLDPKESEIFYVTLKVNTSAPINHVITNEAHTNYSPTAECQVRVVGAPSLPPVTPPITPPPVTPPPVTPPPVTPPVTPPTIAGAPEFAIFLLKVVSHETAKPGDILTYALHWKNTGTATLTNVVLTDAIPAGTTYVEGSATTDHNATVSFEGGVLVWRFDKIDPNTRGIYIFNVRINDDTRGMVENTAIIDSDQTDPERSTVQTTIIAVAPAVFGPPTAPVLVAAPPTPLRRVAGALPVTGANLLVYFLSAVFLIGTGIGLQRLK